MCGRCALYGPVSRLREAFDAVPLREAPLPSVLREPQLAAVCYTQGESR